MFIGDSDCSLYVHITSVLLLQCRQGKNAEESIGNKQLHHEPKEQVVAVESTEGKSDDSECRSEKEAGNTARHTQAIKAAWRKASKVRYLTNVAFR